MNLLDDDVDALQSEFVAAEVAIDLASYDQIVRRAEDRLWGTREMYTFNTRMATASASSSKAGAGEGFRWRSSWWAAAIGG